MREITQQILAAQCLTAGPIAALQENAEAYLVGLFEDTDLYAIHVKCVTTFEIPTWRKNLIRPFQKHLGPFRTMNYLSYYTTHNHSIKHNIMHHTNQSKLKPKR